MALLSPWPFVEGGASAVEVALVFDGATLERRWLWRGGPTEARDPAGRVVVRLGADGFEVALPRGCAGEVRVGARVADVRELFVCGVQAVPIGPRTEARVRDGALEIVARGATAPRRLPLAPPRMSRATALAAVAIFGALIGFAVQPATPAPIVWTLGEPVRARVALLAPVPGGRAATQPGRVAAETQPRRRDATQPPQPPQPMQPTQATQAQRAKAAMTRMAQNVAAASSSAAAAAASATAAAERAQEAQRAAAAQARAAGVVGALAQARAALLGAQLFATADASETGAIGTDGARAATTDADADASGATSGSATGAASGSATGSASGSATGSAGASGVDGDAIGDAYGVGGLGLAGDGAGGGGAGDAIGLGDIGTLAYGSGTGEGVGYGSGVGALAGRVTCAIPDLVGRCAVRGSCDKEIIRRVVRAHVNEVRFCYERSLQSRPAESGRVLADFVVARGGRVVASAVAESTLPDAAVGDCVAAAVARWTFPSCVAEVRYPFVFVPSDEDEAVATRSAP